MAVNDAMIGAANAVSDAVSDAMSGAEDAVSGAMNGAVDAVSGAMSDAADAVSGAMSDAEDAVSGAMNGAADAVSRVMSGASEAASEVGSQRLNLDATQAPIGEPEDMAARQRPDVAPFGPTVGEPAVPMGEAVGELAVPMGEAVDEPAPAEPVMGQRVVTGDAPAAPMEKTVKGPEAPEPVMGEPVMGEPVMGEPVMGEPVMGEPEAPAALMEKTVKGPANNGLKPSTGPARSDEAESQTMLARAKGGIQGLIQRPTPALGMKTFHELKQEEQKLQTLIKKVELRPDTYPSDCLKQLKVKLENNEEQQRNLDKKREPLHPQPGRKGTTRDHSDDAKTARQPATPKGPMEQAKHDERTKSELTSREVPIAMGTIVPVEGVPIASSVASSVSTPFLAVNKPGGVSHPAAGATGAIGDALKDANAFAKYVKETVVGATREFVA